MEVADDGQRRIPAVTVDVRDATKEEILNALDNTTRRKRKKKKNATTKETPKGR